MNGKKQKNWTTTLVLSLILGYFGFDRFYLGKVKTGVLKLITLGGLYVWWLYDIALILSDKMKDKEGNSLKKEHKDWMITLFLSLFSGLFSLGFLEAGNKESDLFCLFFYLITSVLMIFTIWLLYYSVTILRGREDFSEKLDKNS